MGGRRYSDGARRRPGRNSGSGGGPGGSVVFPQVPPLPASTLDYWHSELGAAISGGTITSWTSQILGIAVNKGGQVNDANYGVDTGFFNGRAVVQMVKATPRVLINSAAPTIFTSGQRPYTFCVFRYTAPSADSTLFSFGILGTGFNYHEVIIDNAHGGGGGSASYYLNTNIDTPPNAAVDNATVLGTTVHTSQAWCVTTTANLQIDNTNASNGATGAAIAATPTQVAFGQDAVGGRFADVNMAFILCCSAVPSAGEIAALRSWASGYWGAP